MHVGSFCHSFLLTAMVAEFLQDVEVLWFFSEEGVLLLFYKKRAGCVRSLCCSEGGGFSNLLRVGMRGGFEMMS